MHFSEKTIFFLAIVICLMASFSCKYKQQRLFETRTNPNKLTPHYPATKNYQISPQDLLQIRNLQNRNYIANDLMPKEAGLSGKNDDGQTYLVEADSTVALPMLGHVKVAGLSRVEAAHHIETLYRKELKDPIIELKIVNLKVTLLGEVKNQGIYVLSKDYTSMVEIIGTAGGLTDKADGKNIKIIRGNPQAPQVFELDISDLKTLSDPRIMLQNNDIIYVAQHKKAIQTQKLQSVSAVLQPVLTLLNTVLIIYTLTR